MNRYLLIAGTIGSAMTAAALAQPAPAAPEANKTEAETKMICRMVQQIGSRLNRRRVCWTQAQWDEIDQENRLAVDRIQNGRQTSGN